VPILIRNAQAGERNIAGAGYIDDGVGAGYKDFRPSPASNTVTQADGIADQKPTAGKKFLASQNRRTRLNPLPPKEGIQCVRIIMNAVTPKKWHLLQVNGHSLRERTGSRTEEK
jgi:hypothetical protein